MDSFSSRAAPYYRGGAYVEFKPKKMRAIAGKIYVMEKGKKEPAEFWQLIVRVGGIEAGCPVVTGGEFYLENIEQGTYDAVIKKGDKECGFKMVIPESEKPLIELDEIVRKIK